MKLIKKFIMTIVSVFLILLVTFNVYNFVSINLLHKDMATIGGYALLEVVSGSMEPTIYKGDIIVINTNCKEYTNNDIITFRDINDAFVTHRIKNIDIEKKVMITQGDANISQDDEMSTNSIVGKYVLKIPAAGKIMLAFKNPLVMLLILVIGIIVCALVSTDDNLTPKDITDEEKEFLEFKKQKELEKKKEDVQVSDVEVREKKSPKKSGEVKSPTKKKTTSRKSVEASSKGEVKKVTKKTSNTGKEKKDTAKNSVKKVVKEPVKKTSVKGSSSKTTTKKSTTKKTK